MKKDLEKISKLLSYILRHKPESIGLKLDDNGWGNIEFIINNSNQGLTRELIEIVVETNDKKRFGISEDGISIRANQGHSIKVDLDLDPSVPPSILLHGTAERFVESIRGGGLKKQKRHHVHLSETESVARAVGSRYGKPVILKIDAKLMSSDGYTFYKTENNVWLVGEIPIKYISGL